MEIAAKKLEDKRPDMAATMRGLSTFRPDVVKKISEIMKKK